jgi:hypothetical protein
MSTTFCVRRTTAALVAVGASLILFAQPASGQARSPLTLQIQVGAVDAAGELPDAPILGSPGAVVSYGALDPQYALGLALVIATPTRLDLRIRAAKAMDESRIGTWGCAADSNGEPVACPSILLEIPTEMSMSTVGVDALVDLPIGRAVIRPSVGVAYVRHAYSWDPESDSSFSLEPGEYIDGSFALSLGGAIAVPVSAAEVSLEFIGDRSSATLTRSNRLGTVMLGVGVPLF